LQRWPDRRPPCDADGPIPTVRKGRELSVRQAKSELPLCFNRHPRPRREHHRRESLPAADQRRLFHLPEGDLSIHSRRRRAPPRAIPKAREGKEPRGPYLRWLLAQYGHLQG